MKVKSLQLRNFTVFEQADFELASGINVFIGENGTGKSHVLKLIYALLRGIREQKPDKREDTVYQRERLANVFRVDDGNVSRLIRVNSSNDFEETGTWLNLRADLGETRCSLSDSGDLELGTQVWQQIPQAIFIPARDVLAMYEGFVSIYERQKISFDETYRDLCVALGDAELRGEAKKNADEFGASLRDMIRGNVTLEDGRFYFDFGSGKHEAHLVAEGLRKIGTLAHLIGNGSIRQGSVLLWDEPEANMNPKLITKVAQALHALAAGGVQICVATHDYLLAHKLSLIAEYDIEPNVELEFFALHHEKPIDPIAVEAAPSLAKIQYNAILDEYANHHDAERNLYENALKRDLGKGA